MSRFDEERETYIEEWRRIQTETDASSSAESSGAFLLNTECVKMKLHPRHMTVASVPKRRESNVEKMSMFRKAEALV